MVYSIIGIVAIIINLLINRDVFWPEKGNPESAAQTAYRHFNYGILAYHVTDALWGFCDASGSQLLLYSDTVIYYIAMYLAVMLWARYAVIYINERGKYGKVLLSIANVLFLLELAALVINHKIHFFFWVDEAGDYHAYAFRHLALIIQILLFLTTSWTAFRRRKKADSEAIRSRHKILGGFGLTMAAAIVVQIYYPLLPFYSIGYMIGTCLIHSFVIEDENAELRRKADEANQAKSKFLFNMSHDMRTPMNAILGYTDIGMRHTEDQSTVKDSFDKIKLSGAHLLQIINDTLEMGRIESGNLELNPVPTDIREAVNVVRDMNTMLAASKEVNFTVEVGDMPNPYVYADELRVNEVLINLISNAVKFTPAGGTVRYTAAQTGEVQPDGKARYRFVVEDSGIGMSEAFLTHLFEPFSRERSATVSKTEGTGLGLAIVKKIVDMSGGTIAVKSTQDEGTTFTVDMSFPVMDRPSIEQFCRERADRPPTEDVNLKGRKVLLAEDNELNREIAEYILTEAGLKIETAEDGSIALKKVQEKGIDGYDFILMDIQMPVMDGYEATAAIRALPGGDRIPIIALSANAMEEDIRRAKENGMNAHVAKPIDVKLLLKTMHDLLPEQP